MLLPRQARRGQAGFTFVELSVVLIILLVALLIFSSTLNGIAKQRAVNHESALAMAAARNMLETLRSEEFDEIFALYNDDPNDDPDGAGTAPGNRFDVPKLTEAPDVLDGFEGEIVFPAVDDPVEGLQLQEDVVDRELGMPRDLTGDSIIDGEDHSGSYFILPLQVRIRWTGKSGTREYRLTTQICRLNKA